jgi:predicted nucleic-acid-binding protein
VIVLSVDTNVLARYLLGDDPVQKPIAERIIADGAYVSLTVLLETYWLLTSRYRLATSQFIQLVRLLRENANVQIEADEWLDWMLDRLGCGADFADLAHLVASQNQSAFATFDQAMVKQAGQNAPAEIVVLR